MSPKVGVEPIRQTQIIESAFRLFAKHGSNNVSVQSVATEAGREHDEEDLKRLRSLGYVE